MEQYKMIVNGEAVAAVSANWETVINPATEDGIAEVPQADYTDVDNAVKAAKSAFTSWSQLSPGERSTLIYKLADALEAKTDQLAQIESSALVNRLNLSLMVTFLLRSIISVTLLVKQE